jgi:RNA polymerase sigma-70 factor (ECF subfamily)
MVNVEREGLYLEQQPALHAPSDDVLLASIGAGDSAALEALYDRHHRTAMALAYRLLGDRLLAEDVVQEAFVSVWRRAGTFQPDRGSGRGWLLALVRNRAIDRLRRSRSQPLERELDPALEYPDQRGPEPFTAAYDALRAEQVRRALQALPSEQRQSLELAYFAGRTQQEVADETGVPLGTVKSRIRLALVRLKQLLDHELDGGA